MKKIIFNAGILALLLMSCKKNVISDEQIKSVPGEHNVRLATEAIPNDPFTPYMTSTPVLFQTIGTSNSTVNGVAITTKRFTFKSKGGVNTVFAIMSYPQASGTYPGIVFNHGAGGNAETQRGYLATFAAKGYVTIAIDVPGIANQSNSTTDPLATPNSSGPWKSLPNTDAPKLNVTGGAQNSVLFDAGVAGLEAFNYLSAQANVNNTKMAITGSSYGGYLTTMLSGMLGSRVKAAYSVYGCGFFDYGTYLSASIAAMSAADRTTWETYLDAGRRCPYITAPYFIEEPTNDFAFWPEGVKATLSAIPGTKNLVVMPNLNHTDIPAGGTMRQLYIDYYLKATGSPFGSIQISSTTPQSGGSLAVNLNVSLPAGVSATAVRLYYSVQSANWQSNHWDSTAATLVSGTNYQAVLSASLVNQNVNYFASVVDSRTVTTSTTIQQTGFMSTCDATTGWGSGNTLSLNTSDKKEGSGSLQSVGSGTDEFKQHFATPYNSGVSSVTGYLTFWYYVSDATKFSGADQIELGSGGAADVNEFSWKMGPVVNGWNFISKPFSGASVTGGAPNVNALNWFRVYHAKTASVTTKIDAIQIMR